MTRSGIQKTLHSTQKPPVTGSGPGPGLDCPKISPPIKRIHCVPLVVAGVRLQCNTVTNSTRWYSLIIGFVSLLYTIPPVRPGVFKPRLALRRRGRKIYSGESGHNLRQPRPVMDPVSQSISFNRPYA